MEEEDAPELFEFASDGFGFVMKSNNFADVGLSRSSNGSSYEWFWSSCKVDVNYSILSALKVF